MRTLIRKTYLLALMWTLGGFPLVAHAGILHENCNGTRGLTRIQNAINILQRSGSEGSNTILVSGACKENITIQSMDNLTLTAENGASITDSSNGNLDLIDIFDSRRVSVNGFTINGGANGVVCADASLCRLSGNTVQGSSGYGVIVSSSHASLNGDTLRDNAGRGLSIINGGEVADATAISVQGSFDGIVLNTRGTLTLSSSTVQGNQNRGISPTSPGARVKPGERPHGSRYFRFSMLSSLYVAAAMPPGVETELLDEEIRPVDYDTDADLIGITFMTFNAPRAYEIADRFRTGSHKPVILGGYHPSFLPE